MPRAARLATSSCSSPCRISSRHSFRRFQQLVGGSVCAGRGRQDRQHRWRHHSGRAECARATASTSRRLSSTTRATGTPTAATRTSTASTPTRTSSSATPSTGSEYGSGATAGRSATTVARPGYAGSDGHITAARPDSGTTTQPHSRSTDAHTDCTSSGYAGTVITGWHRLRRRVECRERGGRGRGSVRPVAE